MSDDRDIQDFVDGLESKPYPKYQYSVFLKDNRDEQIVIRAGSFQELIDAKKQINVILDKVEKQEIKEVKEPEPVTQTQDVPSCPHCGSEMWDNRPKKAAGEFNPKAPDFKCKNQKCAHVIWPK